MTTGAPRDWTLYRKLSGFYAIYFATAGVFVPYWAVYLHELGFTTVEIGAALATMGLMRVGAPFGWGWLMDRLGKRMPLIAFGMAVACCFVAAIAHAQDFAALLLLHAGFGIFWNACIPAFDVVTLGHATRAGLDYPRVRLWGSVGFIAGVVASGPLLDRTGLGAVPWLVIAGLLVLVAAGLRTPDSEALPAAATPDAERFITRLRSSGVIPLLVCCFILQVGFAPFFGFFSLFLAQHGYDNAVTGYLWGVSIVAEVAVFLFAGQLIRRYGARAIFLVAAGTASLRWLGTAQLVDNLWLLGAVQLLHLSSGGLYHAVTVHYVHRLFPAHMQGRAQALLSGTSFGLGGAVGNYASGALWDGNGERVFLLAAAAAAIAFVAAWLSVRDDVRK